MTTPPAPFDGALNLNVSSSHRCHDRAEETAAVCKSLATGFELANRSSVKRKQREGFGENAFVV